MASPTGPPNVARCRSANRASAPSIAAFAFANEARASIIVQRLHAEGAIRQLGELLHACFRLGERPRRLAQTGDALLEQGERFGEIQRLPLQSVHDRLE